MLIPLAALYALAVRLRFFMTSPVRLPVPVICVGNLVMGGAGKTPTTIAIAGLLRQAGKTPHILSRGYGADIQSPTRVDQTMHTSAQVGDEPLLLARAAPTWVYKNRTLSGPQAIAAGADILILDDGFQNPALHKDLSLLVIDGQQGLGNGLVFPAGPLRESIPDGLMRCDAIILIGQDIHGLERTLNKPVIHASIRYTNADPKRVYAFTGLGFPQKFFKSLADLGYDIAAQQAFPDHHPYTGDEMESLIQTAKDLNGRLITTQKDLLRIAPEYHKHIDILNIDLVFDDVSQLNKILAEYL